MTTEDAKDLTDKSVRNVYIKDGKRKFMSDGGWMFMDADRSRKAFGNQRGGKYSEKQ